MNPATLSTFSIVVPLLSLVIGVGTQAIQTGKLLGQFQLSTAAMMVLTLALPFVGGVSASLTSAGVLTTASVFYAVVAGVLDVVAGSVPGLAVHAHFVVPAKMAALRALCAAKTDNAAPKA
ncbi:MAG: hypothetical protein KGI71_04825 [Patescibacteria group bacterium]|nr:hypothetical protein [Patescibacteria group bacterium]